MEKHILKIDALAGLCAGILLLVFQNLIAKYYVVPRDLVVLVGIVNMAYGIFGGANLLFFRRKSLFKVLISANFFWALCCFAFCLFNFQALSGLALAHGLLEGFFVKTLATFETRNFTIISEVNALD